VAIDYDGKIVAAGAANTGSNYDFAVARFGVPGTQYRTIDRKRESP